MKYVSSDGTAELCLKNHDNWIFGPTAHSCIAFHVESLSTHAVEHCINMRPSLTLLDTLEIVSEIPS